MDRDRLSHAGAEKLFRTEPRQTAHGYRGRTDRCYIKSVPGADGQLRAVSRSQVRSNSDPRLLCAGRNLSEHTNAVISKRAWTGGWFALQRTRARHFRTNRGVRKVSVGTRTPPGEARRRA